MKQVFGNNFMLKYSLEKLFEIGIVMDTRQKTKEAAKAGESVAR